MVRQMLRKPLGEWSTKKLMNALNIFRLDAVKYGYRSSGSMEAQVLPEKVVDSEVRPERERSKPVSEPKFLLDQSFRQLDGTGPAVGLDGYTGKLLVVTLSINAVPERTGLTISVWGSPDQLEWGAQPLVTLRQRQYCGVYSALLNLSHRPDTRFLRVQWNINRWGKGESVPQFGFQVFLEESGARVSSSAYA